MEAKIWNPLIHCSWNLSSFHACLTDFGIHVHVCVLTLVCLKLYFKEKSFNERERGEPVCDRRDSWVLVRHLNKIYDNPVFYLLYLRDTEAKARVVN